ncbi:MAG: hypothetical protein AAFP84_21575 [Actinomycetota bacterium]
MTWQYVVFSLLTYGALSLVLLVPFIADAGMKSSLGAGVVFVAEVVGLAVLIWRFTKCGVFVDAEGITLTTVTRTTSIPFARLRIYRDNVSLIAQAAPVPEFRDTVGRTVKAGVLAGIDPADKLGIVRTILRSRAAATSHGAPFGDD